VTKSAGYSGTPLVKKLGIKADKRSVAIAPPNDYAALIEYSNVDEVVKAEKLSGQYDFIHLFNKTERDLNNALPICEKHLAEGGMIWASWPKKSSKLWIDLTEGGIRTAAFPLNLVDVKVCAVDKDWSGLKLMRRKKPKT